MFFVEGLVAEGSAPRVMVMVAMADHDFDGDRKDLKDSAKESSRFFNYDTYHLYEIFKT